MARIRSIHPGFATDEDFVTISRDARLFFLLLLTECDDQGLFEWKPTTLKMRIFPADNVDIAALLSELSSIDAVRNAEIDGHKIGAVRNFRKFQRPKSPNATLPIDDDFRNYVGLSGPPSEMPADDAEPFPGKEEKSPQMEEGGGRMKGEDGELPLPVASQPSGEAARKRATRLPQDFVLPREWRQEAAAKRAEHRLPPIDLDLEAEKFTNFWLSKSGGGGAKLDWHRTWVNWALNARPDMRGQANGTRQSAAVAPDFSAPLPERIRPQTPPPSRR